MKSQSTISISVILLWFTLFSPYAIGQDSYKVLFLGNSYTNYNNLPKLISDVALSAGDTLTYDSNTPGGFRLTDHLGNTTSRNKIMAGNWDYVVMQGQSQEPITQSGNFTHGLTRLRNLTLQHSPCAELMTYMTWGRENGDASNCATFPAMCTYIGMDTTLMHKYLHNTDIISGQVSPVSVVWRYLRTNHPNINLYASDGSHPSASGSYAAACSFYVSIFKKDPSMITFDFGLDSTTASTIRSAAKAIVFNQLSNWDFRKISTAKFRTQKGAGATEMEFSAINPFGITQSYHWDLGDGTTDSTQSVVHNYATNGTYTVQLTTTTCGLNGVHSITTDTTFQLCTHTPTVYMNQTWLCEEYDTLWTQPADQYQWYVGSNLVSVPIPGETDSVLINPSQYVTPRNSWISVLATKNGCSEISRGFVAVSFTYGIYTFDLDNGDPCAGDTAIMVVRLYGKPVAGSEIISWYKDGNLLPMMANEDTLLITQQGAYSFTVVNPQSNCPFDTTFSSMVDFSCTNLELNEQMGFEQDLVFTVFPNPASAFITIEFPHKNASGVLEIYDLTGRLLIKQTALNTTQVDITKLSKGVYFITLDRFSKQAVRFIKH